MSWYQIKTTLKLLKIEITFYSFLFLTGTKLALIEAKMVIAKILHKFIVTTTDRFEDIVIVPAVIPAPERPVNFILRKRPLIHVSDC